MSRPQVSIDRLTPRRVTVEPRESMNCKSCRKRKIKCNRMRPSCEACKVFQCPCIYDAVPKKRGPKTDVLEALLKRVDGLEKRLQDEKNPISPTSPIKNSDEDSIPADSISRRNTIDSSFSSAFYNNNSDSRSLSTPVSNPGEQFQSQNGFIQQQPSPPNQHPVLPDTLLDAYFSRLHGKPYFILDESTARQCHQIGQLPVYLSMAIHSITLRYSSTAATPEQSLRTGLEYALQARRMVDIDNPSIEGLQTLLLLCQTFFAHGLGKKAYMTFSNCVAMVVALDLYREVPSKANLPASEREMRRRLFWSAYLMDRFITCGSRRPCLISDHSIVLRLPSWSPHAAGLNVEGEVFNTVGPNIQYSSDSRRKGQGAAALLIDITRILGITNRYLAAGGVKGDSHFPWHSLSNLSKIRQELDIWAAGTQDVFASIEALFGHPESTTLLLSKLIYHLVHCLLYRPFLPIDLVELRGTGQHQSWQIEATNLCFAHSNAIAELVELGRSSPLIECPAFIGYCVCTAGTVHVHGVHYNGREGEVFASSAEFLTREMHQLTWLRSYWAGVQHQKEMLQTIYTCHADLVRTLASSPMRFSPVFHLEDFLDRYPGLTVDGAHVRLIDIAEEHPMQYVDRHDMYYRSVPYQPGIYPVPPSNHTIPRRDSQGMAKNHPIPVSPTLNFHHPQQSPQLSSIYHIPSDLAPDSTSLSQGFSPSVYGFSPSTFLPDSTAALNVAPTPPSNPQYATFPFDATATPSQPAVTPGAQSQASGSHTTAGAGGSDNGSSEKDPFLSLLEQLAENEQNSQGGPSELDFFLTSTEEAETTLVAETEDGTGEKTA
ncbi:hypothetical protein AWENTII_004000 [Aspergillus wentii]